MCHPRILLLLPALIPIACGGRAATPTKESPRPVEVYELRAVDPSGPLELSGSVTSWKEQDIGFEVGGRIRYVQERGATLEGRWEEDGEVHVEGQVLARLDDEPYGIAVASAEAAVDVSREQVGVVDAQLEKLLPANLRSAKAEEALAEAEYQRYRKAGETNAVSEVDVLRAEASRNVTSAQVEQAEAAFDSTQAQRRSLVANLAQAEQQLEDARWQLDRCSLYAPFTGDVTEIYVEAGGIVQPGQAVAHLVMMDPIQIDVAISESTLQELQRYTAVQLRVPGVPDPMAGRIYDLATVADPRTRTYRASILVRNRPKFRAGAPGEEADSPFPIRHLMVPLKMAVAESAIGWAVEARRSLKQDEQGWFVWAAADPARTEDLDHDYPVFTVRKVRVTPGERQMNFQGIYVMRELVDGGELEESTILPLDLPADFPEGERVVLAEPGWLLRPGQVVSVLLTERVPQTGLYVPMTAVLPERGEVGRVFVARDGQARSVRIELNEREGPLVRVRAVDPAEAELVGPGAQIIRQAHFLHDGEAIRVVRTHEVHP